MAWLITMFTGCFICYLCSENPVLQFLSFSSLSLSPMYLSCKFSFIHWIIYIIYLVWQFSLWNGLISHVLLLPQMDKLHNPCHISTYHLTVSLGTVPWVEGLLLLYYFLLYFSVSCTPEVDVHRRPELDLVPDWPWTSSVCSKWTGQRLASGPR